MISVLLVLGCYLIFCADSHLLGYFPHPFQYYWAATAALLAIYFTTVREHSQRWYGLDEWLLDKFASPRAGTSSLLPIVFGLLFFGILLLGIYQRLPLIFERPIIAWHADMLPTIRNAVRDFLTGKNPYAEEYHFSGGVYLPWEVHLPFLPVLWLSYVLPEIAGWDYRFWGLTFNVAVVGIFYMLLLDGWRNSRREGGGRPLALFSLCSLLLAASFLLNPKNTSFTPIMHTPPWWFCLAAFCYWAIKGKTTAASVALGLCSAMRPSAIVLLPHWLFFLWRNDPEKFGRRIVQLFGPLVVFVGPFLLLNPVDFIYGTFWWYDVARIRVWAEWPEWVLNTFSLSSPLYAANLTRWILPLQILLLVLITFWGWQRIRTLNDCLRFMSWSLFLFSVTVSMPFFYIFIPCFLLLSFSVMTDMSRALKLSLTEEKDLKHPVIGSFLASILLVILAPVFYGSVSGRIDFGSPQARQFLVDGWSGDERTSNDPHVSFVWADSRQASVWLPMQRRTDRIVEFRVLPFAASGLPIQTIDVTVNGTHQAQLQAKPGWHTYTLSVAQKAWIVGNNQVTLKFAYAVAPSEMRLSQDKRTLAAAFDYLWVRPKS